MHLNCSSPASVRHQMCGALHLLKRVTAACDQPAWLDDGGLPTRQDAPRKSVDSTSRSTGGPYVRGASTTRCTAGVKIWAAGTSQQYRLSLKQGCQ